MTQPLEQSLLDVWPQSSWSNTRLLIAVSGGADSVALLRAMVNLSQQRGWIHVAHFNHEWRGAESDADEEFVCELCKHLSLSYVSVRANEFSQVAIERSEQAAREVRYQFLTETAYRLGARYVVTAHTASDRVETMLHNLCRGTGLNGVASPTRFRNLDRELVLARPLLRCSRTQVIDYLTALGQEYRTDSSNSDTTFKRNFLRHKLLPLLQAEYGDRIESHLLDFSDIAEETTNALRFYAERWVQDFRDHESQLGELIVSTDGFRSTPWPVVQIALEACWKQNRWPLQAMSRRHWLQIRDLGLATEPSKLWQVKLNLPGDLRASTKIGLVRIASA